eukprot:3097842-Rhodomonas_salina.1
MSTLSIIPQDSWLKYFNEARITAPQARAIQLAGLRECIIAGHWHTFNNTYRSRVEALRSSQHISL